MVKGQRVVAVTVPAVVQRHGPWTAAIRSKKST